MAREDIKKDNRDNLYLVNKELSLLSLLSLKKRRALLVHFLPEHIGLGVP